MSATREVWGAEVSLLTLAAALRARGVNVAVVALPGELAEQSRAAGHDVYVADPGSETRRVLVAGRLWREYVRHVRPGDRLVLFSYILTAWAPRYRPRLSAQGVRISLDLHDQLESRKAYWSVRVASEAVDTVIACSAFTASQMGAREGVYALHRPVTTDLAHSGIADPAAELAASPPSLSTSHGVRTDDDERNRADLAGSAVSAAEELMPGRRALREGAQPSGGDQNAARGVRVDEGEPAPLSGRGAQETVASRRAARAGIADEGMLTHADHGAGYRPGRRGSRRAARTGLLGGAAPEAGPRTPEATRPFRVGIVGRISREKRHELVIAAMSLIDRNVQLVVRGSAFGEGHEYAAEVDEAGARLLGAGYVNEGRVPAAEALSELDAVVVANPAEPMGRTVLEAKLRGVVAVVPDMGGSCELVEDGRTGLVYRANDVDDLARTLQRLVDEPELVARIASDAVDTVPRPAEYAAAYLSRLG